MRTSKQSGHMKYHVDPITGATCTHDDRTVWRLFWLGDGASNIYVGRCMSEPGLISTANGLPVVETQTEFLNAAAVFYSL